MSCASQGKSGTRTKKSYFNIFRQREGEVFIASKAKWDVQLKCLVELERRCQSFAADVEYLGERQEVLKDLVVSKKDMQRTAPVEGVGGAAGKRSFGTRAKEAQVD